MKVRWTLNGRRVAAREENDLLVALL